MTVGNINAKSYLVGFHDPIDDLLAAARNKLPPPPPPPPPSPYDATDLAAQRNTGLPGQGTSQVMPGTENNRLPIPQYIGQIGTLNGLSWVVKEDQWGEMKWNMIGYAPKGATVKFRSFSKRLYRENPDGTLTDVTPQGATSVEKVKDREDTYVVKHEDGSVKEVTYAVDKQGFFQTDETGSPIITRQIETTPPKPEKNQNVKPPIVKFSNPYGMGAPAIDIEPEWDDKSKTWKYDYETARKQALADINRVDTRAKESWALGIKTVEDTQALAKAGQDQNEALTKRWEAQNKALFFNWLNGTPDRQPTAQEQQSGQMPNSTPWWYNLPGGPQMYGRQISAWQAAGSPNPAGGEGTAVPWKPGDTTLVGPPGQQTAAYPVTQPYKPQEPLPSWTPTFPGAENPMLAQEKMQAISANNRNIQAMIAPEYPVATVQKWENLRASLPGGVLSNDQAAQYNSEFKMAQTQNLANQKALEEDSARKAYLKSPYYIQEKMAAAKRLPTYQR